jgi:hypothetical protein
MPDRYIKGNDGGRRTASRTSNFTRRRQRHQRRKNVGPRSRVDEESRAAPIQNALLTFSSPEESQTSLGGGLSPVAYL